MLNKINFKELLLLIRGATLSVYPSIAEGFGIPPLEAAAAGIPSVCSNTTAMADFDFLEMTLFNPLDSKDLNDKIEMAIKLDNLEEVKMAVHKKFNWSLSSENLKALLKNNAQSGN